MKRFKSILLLVLSALPMIYTTVAVMFFLPETIAAHFGINGTPDRYGSKYEAFILPAIIFGVFVIYFLIRKFALRSSTDENSRAANNMSVIDTVMIALAVMFNSLCVFFLIIMAKPEAMKDKENLIFVIISTVVGIMFVVIGNIMPKTKRNNMVGLRLSFAMDTDEHWYIANRAGGVAMVLAGLVTVAAGLIVRNGSYIIWMLISLLLFLIVAIIYSYVKIKGEKKQ